MLPGNGRDAVTTKVNVTTGVTARATRCTTPRGFVATAWTATNVGDTLFDGIDLDRELIAIVPRAGTNSSATHISFAIAMVPSAPN